MAIFGRDINSLKVSQVLPFLDRDDKGILEWGRISWKSRYCANFDDGNEAHAFVPCTVEVLKTEIPHTDQDGQVELRVSYLPHIAGVLVLDANNLTITSSNSAFSSALFGRRNLCGLEIGEILPNFRRLVRFLAREQKIQKHRRNSITIGATSPEGTTLDIEEDQNSMLEEGTVVPEHAFRRAEAMLELRGGDITSSSSSSCSDTTESDGAELVGTLSLGSDVETKINDEASDKSDQDDTPVTTPGPTLGEGLLSSGLLIKPHGLRGVHRDGGEVVVDVQMRVVRPTSDTDATDNIYYALWITYSGPALNIPPLTPLPPVEPVESESTPSEPDTFSSDDEISPEEQPRRRRRSSVSVEATGIDAWEVIEDMGEGAYGSVKLVRLRRKREKVNHSLKLQANYRLQL
jgi:protein-serine/threonine kinase